MTFEFITHWVFGYSLLGLGSVSASMGGEWIFRDDGNVVSSGICLVYMEREESPEGYSSRVSEC